MIPLETLRYCWVCCFSIIEPRDSDIIKMIGESLVATSLKIVDLFVLRFFLIHLSLGLDVVMFHLLDMLLSMEGYYLKLLYSHKLSFFYSAVLYCYPEAMRNNVISSQVDWFVSDGLISTASSTVGFFVCIWQMIKWRKIWPLLFRLVCFHNPLLWKKDVPPFASKTFLMAFLVSH